MLLGVSGRPSESERRPKSEVDKKAAVNLNSSEIKFSQSRVSRQKPNSDLDYDGIVSSMKKKGWAITSIDNNRALAARMAKIDAVANVREFNDVIEDKYRQISLRVGKTIPLTWGEAIKLRINKDIQNDRKKNGSIDKWTGKFPNGSAFDPNVWP